MEQEVRRWVKQAEEEVDTAEINLEAKKYFSAAFWCQQAAEKVLKALLIQKTKSFPKIHDLTQLARLNDAPLHIIELCSKLNPAYIVARYPDAPQKYTEEECKELLKYCKEVLQWATSMLH